MLNLGGWHIVKLSDLIQMERMPTPPGTLVNGRKQVYCGVTFNTIGARSRSDVICTSLVSDSNLG